MAVIRRAAAGDEAAIRALVRGERVNPLGLDWRNFIVAEEAGCVVGSVQLRPSGPGVVEIGTLIVRADLRGGGLGRRLFDMATASAGSRRALAVAAAARAPFYAARGFRAIPPLQAPWPVRRNWLLGQAGSLIALARGMPPRRLAVFDRPGA